jgi:hypothetical protein
MAAFRSAASRSAYGNSKRMDSPGSLPCFGFAKPGAAQLGVRESLETPHLHRAGIRTALAPDTVHLAAPQVVLVVLAGRNRPGCHAGAGSGEWTGPGALYSWQSELPACLFAAWCQGPLSRVRSGQGLPAFG